MEKDKKPQFGCRFLTNEKDVFEHNSWDQVEWDSEMLEEAKSRVECNSSVKLPKVEADHFLNRSSSYWDKFYEQHDSKFFKDRHWLQLEFPEIVKGRESSDLRLLEVGCGVGNSIFPLLDETKDSKLEVFACDHSSVAIDVLQKHPTYLKFQQQIHAFVCDITDEAKISDTFAEANISPNSLDMITLVFILSALRPECHKTVIQTLTRYLKSGGVMLFRDYGRLDMAQLRFKPGQCLEDNLYVRKDGTTSYFFSLEEIENIFKTEQVCPSSPLYSKVLLFEDRRLIVNRARKLRMYRSWIQGRFKKN